MILVKWAFRQRLVLLLVIKLIPSKVVSHVFFNEIPCFKYDDKLWHVQCYWQWADFAFWYSVQNLLSEPGTNTMQCYGRHRVQRWVVDWCETCNFDFTSTESLTSSRLIITTGLFLLHFNLNFRIRQHRNRNTESNFRKFAKKFIYRSICLVQSGPNRMSVRVKLYNPSCCRSSCHRSLYGLLMVVRRWLAFLRVS